LIPALARLSQKVQGQPGIHGEFEASLGYILKPYLKTKFKTNKQKKRLLSWALWLTPISLATHVAEIRKIVVQSQPRQIVLQTLSQKKTHHKNGLIEWLKVKALSSNPSTTGKKKKK
jgi:hypothetical protein